MKVLTDIIVFSGESSRVLGYTYSVRYVVLKVWRFFNIGIFYYCKAFYFWLAIGSEDKPSPSQFSLTPGNQSK